MGVAGTNIINYSKDLFDKLTLQLKESGIETILIDNALYDESSISLLNSVENIILFEIAGETIRTEILKETEMAKNLT